MVIETDALGVIRSVAPGPPASAEITLDGPVIPGMPNCHSHAFQRQMAGLAGFASGGVADSFWTWREAMYRLANRLTPEALEAIARWLYVEMLEAGYTSCAEFHYVHHQEGGHPYDAIDEMGARLLAAASDVGLVLTLLPVLYCRADFNDDQPLPDQRRFVNAPDQYLRLFQACLDRVRDEPHHVVGLALHSLRAVSKAQADEVLAAEAGRAAALHIHVAEQQGEVAQCLEAYGARPVEWLLANVPVDDRWCLVHATHMEPGECRQAAESGAVAGLCPTTEADLGDGFFDGERWLRRNGHLAVGSDSNLRISPAEELRLLEFGLRLKTGRRNVFARKGVSCGRALYESALEGGRMALGQPVGRLEPGFRADLVELDGAHPMLQAVADHDLLDRYVFGEAAGMVRSVFVAGRQIVQNGVHEARDAASAGFVEVMEEFAR